jgi:type II secretory pathway pseudopilin PulG
MVPTTTSQASAASRSKRHFAAFTLTELMIAIAVIVVLAGILLPVLVNAHRKGRLIRLAADLQAVESALEVYHSEFGDYPRLQPPQHPPQNATYGLYSPSTGAATLGKALLGPYGDGLQPNSIVADPADPPAYQASIPYHPGDCVSYSGGFTYVCLAETAAGEAFTQWKWADFDPRDGADGLGFRPTKTIDLNGDGTPDVAGGKVWGPILQPELLKMQGSNVLDHEGHPILYFPTRPGKHNLSDKNPALGVYCDGNDLSYIDAYNNIEFFRHADASPAEPSALLPPMALARIRMMVGDVDLSGYITNTPTSGLNLVEKPVDKPFILWSSGLDGFYGPITKNLPSTGPIGNQSDLDTIRAAVENCDDVTNMK